MTNKVKLLTAFFVLSFAMMMGVTPFSIGGAGVLKAEADTGTGAFKVDVISGTDDDYSYTDNVLTISGDGEYKISMASNVTETNTDTIQVTSGDDAVIVLNGVNISSSSKSPIEIASTAGKVTIKLVGTNTLTATGNAHTGLAISTESEVTITSDVDGDSYVGSLTVLDDNETTSDGVAIGSENTDVNIKITGGKIKAEADGDMYGVAIGNYVGVANITITGGEITAEADADNCGVAIGSYNGVANITITGGEITAEADGDSFGVAIGCCYDTANITITGGEITAEADGDIYGIAIGNVYGASNITIKGGKVRAEADSDDYGVAMGSVFYNANITITGGEITAEAKHDTTGYAVYASNVYISPDGTALNVEYTTNAVYDSESESYEPTDMKYMLCAAETDISGITGGKDYFYCNIMIYQISDYISIKASDDGGDYNVIVSVFGGENARYLDEVMVLACDGTTDNITISNLEVYDKYDGIYNGNEAIVFSVDSNSISEGATIYALVKTYYNYDAENEKDDTVYYLSEDSCIVSGGGAA